MDLDERNIQRIINWVDGKSRFRSVQKTFDPDSLTDVNSDPLLVCLICQEVSLYPVIFPCRHLICENCYNQDFNLRHFHRGEQYFSKCPYCRANVKPEDVHTLKRELQLYPDSPISTFYRNLHLRCDNDGCDQMVAVSNFDLHVRLQCRFRVVPCPAFQCPCIGTADFIKTHSISCPCHYVWCNTCKLHWTVLSTGHSCQMAIQRNILLRKDQNTVSEEQNGNVRLPTNDQFDLTPDVNTIQGIRIAICFKRGRSRRRLYHRFLQAADYSQTIPISMSNEVTHEESLFDELSYSN